MERLEGSPFVGPGEYWIEGQGELAPGGDGDEVIGNEEIGAFSPMPDIDYAGAGRNLQDNNSPAVRAANAAAKIVNLPTLFEDINQAEGEVAKIAFYFDKIDEEITSGNREYAIDVLLNAACSKHSETRAKALALLQSVDENPKTGNAADDKKVRDMIGSSARIMSRLLLSERVKDGKNWNLPVELAELGIANKPKSELAFVYKDGDEDEAEEPGQPSKKDPPISDDVDKELNAYIEQCRAAGQQDNKHGPGARLNLGDD